MDIKNRTIEDLVTVNPHYAKALHFLGIQFAQYAQQSLADVCLHKGLNLGIVIRHLELAGQDSQAAQQTLNRYPIDLVLQYLRHSHQIFIKERLPFIQNLVNDADPSRFDDPSIINDLKFVFPLFAEDFIIHIYHEEDELFGMINRLLDATYEVKNAVELYYLLEDRPIHKFASEHADNDNDLVGIRQLTNWYSYNDQSDLTQKVLFNELRMFESELQTHANVENRVLFPKAMQLENEVKHRLSSFVTAN